MPQSDGAAVYVEPLFGYFAHRPTSPKVLFAEIIRLRCLDDGQDLSRKCLVDFDEIGLFEAKSQLLFRTVDSKYRTQTHARGIAAGLGISGDRVHSPSFTLVHEYEGGRCPLFHVDLYRLDGGEDLEGLGLDELTEAGGVVLVEWGEKLPLWYRRDALTVRFHDLGEDSRQIELDQQAVPAKRRGDAWRPGDRPQGCPPSCQSNR